MSFAANIASTGTRSGWLDDGRSIGAAPLVPCGANRGGRGLSLLL